MLHSISSTVVRSILKVEVPIRPVVQIGGNSFIVVGLASTFFYGLGSDGTDLYFVAMVRVRVGLTSFFCC